jgi:hypothetical protein
MRNTMLRTIPVEQRQPHSHSGALNSTISPHYNFNIYLSCLIKLLSKRLEIPLPNLLDSQITSLRNTDQKAFEANPVFQSAAVMCWFIRELARSGCIAIDVHEKVYVRALSKIYDI